jgi:hypothetical protein
MKKLTEKQESYKKSIFDELSEKIQWSEKRKARAEKRNKTYNEPLEYSIFRKALEIEWNRNNFDELVFINRISGQETEDILHQLKINNYITCL